MQNNKFLYNRLWDHKFIGILGGSFNPLHEGHLNISAQALAKLPINFLWWSFTPGNPFKKHIQIPPVSERIAEAQSHIHNPRIIMCDLEKQLGINRTHQLVSALPFYFPRTKFIWIGGMDLAEEFHNWEKWKDVSASLPIAFFRRPPYRGMVRRLPIRLLKSVHHLYTLPGSVHAYQPGQVFWELHGKTIRRSSTEIRQMTKI